MASARPLSKTTGCEACVPGEPIISTAALESAGRCPSISNNLSRGKLTGNCLLTCLDSVLLFHMGAARALNDVTGLSPSACLPCSA
eukprot:5683034-Pyramimonas_sp.AAC.1